MINKTMFELGSTQSIIRELHEQKCEVDLTIGNPSAPTPSALTEALIELAKEGDHSYTQDMGDATVRESVCRSLKNRFGVEMTKELVYMTCGAASALTISLKAIVNAGDEVIIFAPYFPEYTVYVEGVGATARIMPAKEDFSLNLEALRASISSKTKAVIVNSPNNPSGVVYSEEEIASLAAILRSYGAFLISDEPYREIAYEKPVPYPAKFYQNTLTCYSYSKSLSLPGERIGYIALSPDMPNASEVMCAIKGAGRTLGYICAPALFQKAIAKCEDVMPFIDLYKKNRDTLYDALSAMGYEAVRPDGAFYLMVKSLEEDSVAFAKNAARIGLLVVPTDDFGAKGYIRIAYCVSHEDILKSIPLFQKLYDAYSSRSEKINLDKLRLRLR